ncbi:hypothetical protein IW261DRAFT_18937 [Armillaria novae-zelandiae]|uniref:Uncharacterized protein n=1 Tax=Armillaria novae-zelandiae TaxID=153914 RepID=A0AA39PU22_9AGAR|nr:hypothetical protein IW261DRAFT_18937 [Armillaria novae-zelandiae]
MASRDDAETLSEQASDTGLGEVASTTLAAATDTTSIVAVPSSTGRGLVVVETSTPPEPYSFSMPSATDMPLASSILPVLASSAGPTSADIPSSLATAANPIPTIAPVSISRWYTILPVSDPSAPTTSADMASLFYSIVSAAGPSLSPWYSILPVSVIPTSSPASADEPTSLFYPIVTAPASSATTFVYSILPVSDTSTSSSTIAYTSIPSSTTPIADPTPTPDASIFRMSDTITIPTSSSSILRVSESTTPESPLVYSILPISEPSTLVYSIQPVSDSSTLVYSTQPVSDAPGRTGVPTSTPTSPGISPTTGPSTSTSNSRIAITTDTPAPDAYHSTSSLSTDEAPATSSQRINNLALHPTSASTVLVTSGSITQTYVVRPTGGITGVGGSSSSGPGEEGPSSG